MFVAMDSHSFKTIENPGFKWLMYVADPEFKIPSRKVVSKSIIPKLYQDKKNELYKTLAT